MQHLPQSSRVVLSIIITLSVQALVSMAAVSVPVFMPAASEELYLKPNLVGLFVTLIYVGATLSAPGSGAVINRLGPIRVSQVCLLLCALGSSLFFLSTMPWMVLGALLIGLGYGPVTPASSHLLVKTTPPQVMAMVFSIMLGLLGIAMAFASFGTALFSAEWSHSAVLLVCIVFGSAAIGWNGVYLAEVARVVRPELAGLATGGSLFFTFCGVLFGLPIFSFLVDFTGSYSIGFLCTGLATLIYGTMLCFSKQA